MRNAVFFLCGLYLSLSTCYCQIIIEGKILNYDGEDGIAYNQTIEGVYAPKWETLKPNRDGSFKIQYENEDYGTTKISYKSLVYRLFHDGDSRIYLEIDDAKIIRPEKRWGRSKIYINDSIKQVATTQISGDFKEINQFYNRNLRSAYHTTRSVSGNYYSRMLAQATTPEQVGSMLDSLMQIEFEQIEALPEYIEPEGKHSDTGMSIKRFLRNEVKAFYGGVFLSTMSLKRKAQIEALAKDSTAELTIYNREWEQLIEDFAYQTIQDLEPVPNSSYYMDFLESLEYTLKAYREYDFPQSGGSLDQWVVDRLFNYDTLLFRDEETIFSYQLHGLQLFLNDQLFYSPVLLHAVYEIQKQYPNSANMKRYEPLITKIESYLEASQQPYDKGKIIRRDYASFRDLLSRFEGKNVLIDIWATWCHPCIADFQHKDEIQSFIDQQEVELLYISIDQPEWEDRWKQAIKFNQLSGYHYRANTEFIQDMWEVLEGMDGAIPRYILVDKDGGIFIHTAARPSESEKLKEQITDLLAERQSN